MTAAGYDTYLQIQVLHPRMDPGVRSLLDRVVNAGTYRFVDGVIVMTCRQGTARLTYSHSLRFTVTLADQDGRVHTWVMNGALTYTPPPTATAA